jgi:ketosteroid isomerase-like protein
MSKENVEIVRRLYEATAQRDGATAFSLYHPEVEYDVSRVGIGNFTTKGTWYGHAGIRRLLDEWNEAWEAVEYELTELIDAGDKVISVVDARGRGRGSGLEVELRGMPVFTLHEGKVIQVVWFPTREEALKAAGLSE